jgi:hypothetical protein
VPRFRQLVVAGLSPRRLGFDPRPFRVRFMEERVVLGYVLRHVRREFQSVWPSSLLPVYLSVHLSTWNKSAPIGQIFVRFDIRLLFKNLPWKINFHYYLMIIIIIIITGTYIKTNTHFDHISLNSGYNEKCFRQICRKNQNTRLTFSNIFQKIVSFNP